MSVNRLTMPAVLARSKTIALITLMHHLNPPQLHIIGFRSKVGITSAFCQMKNAQLYVSVNVLHYDLDCDWDWWL